MYLNLLCHGLLLVEDVTTFSLLQIKICSIVGKSLTGRTKFVTGGTIQYNMSKQHLNNELLLVWYSDVWYSNGCLNTRLNLVWYSNGILILHHLVINNFQSFEYQTSPVFRSPLYPSKFSMVRMVLS